MAYPENILTLDILPLSADTARLVRVYGTAPCVVLPAVLPAPEGGSFAVTELGGYCFSEKPRSLACGRQDLPLYGGAGRHGAADPGIRAGGGRNLPPV
ncbi:MAG: hypothetical protein ACLUFD_03365 [Faecalibacterium sp.]